MVVERICLIVCLCCIVLVASAYAEPVAEPVANPIVIRHLPGGMVEFSQVVWPDSPSGVKVLRAAVRKGKTSPTLRPDEFTALGGDTGDAKTAAVTKLGENLAKTKDVVDVATRYMGGILTIKGGNYTFSYSDRTREGAPSPGGSGGLIGASLLKLLAGPNSPLELATVVVDKDVTVLVGIGAWLPRSRHTIYTPDPEADLTCTTWWRFTEYSVGDGAPARVLVEAFVTLPAKGIFTVTGEPGEPTWGLVAGYGMGGADRPFYLGVARHIADRFSLTAGGAFGGGESPALGYGVTFDITDIFGSVTAELSGTEKKKEEQQQSE
ncbi:hypothetical protein LLH03_00035 [bacterium]|nr:hypothetical protein [bacterium]